VHAAQADRGRPRQNAPAWHFRARLNTPKRSPGDCVCHGTARARRAGLAKAEPGAGSAGRGAAQQRRLDLEAGTVRVRAAFIERSTGEILLGPPKSKAGRRVVGVPQAIIPVLREHLAVFVKDEPGALVFPGVKGGPLRRCNFNKMSAWPQAVKSIDAEGLHFHDLRHTGNTFAASSGAKLRDLMVRMEHDSERAALIYHTSLTAQTGRSRMPSTGTSRPSRPTTARRRASTRRLMAR
jgi:Phage integrase family